jgi:hypothetical protein
MEFPKATTLIPNNKYVITFDGLVFVGLYISSDKKHKENARNYARNFTWDLTALSTIRVYKSTLGIE